MTARIKDLNEAFYGLEPTLLSLDDYELKLSTAINWYSYNSDWDKRKQWTLDFAEQQKYSPEQIRKLKDTSKYKFSTFAYLARILCNDGLLSSDHKNRLDAFVQNLLSDHKEFDPVLPEQKKTIKATPSIDLMKNEIDFAVDRLIKFKEDNHNQLIVKLELLSPKKSDCEELKSYLQKYISDFEDFKQNKSEYVYHPDWTTILTNKRIRFLNSVSESLDGLIDEFQPKKRRSPKPGNVFKSFKCCREIVDLGLKSISLDKILSASELWIYDTDHRQLIRLLAETKFTVSGTTIEGIKEAGSFKKTIRKPKEQLTEFMKCNKITSVKFVEAIKSVKNESVTGRMNESRIILKVF